MNNDKASNTDLRTLKPDIKNQLSNIALAVEQLRFEIDNPTDDCVFYLDTVAAASKRINTLLDEAQQQQQQ